jgi:hypothetical protein
VKTFLVKYFAPVILATAASDNLSLNGRDTGGILTMFIILSPIFLAFTILYTSLNRNVYKINFRIYSDILIIIILCSLGISVLFSPSDPLSLSQPRFIFLIYTVVFSVVFVRSLRGQIFVVLINGVKIFIVISLIISVFQLLVYFRVIPYSGVISGILTVDLSTVADYPRIEGLVSDPNRFSTLLALMLGLCYLLSSKHSKYALPKIYIFIAIALTIASFSRTSLVILIIMFLFGFFYRTSGIIKYYMIIFMAIIGIGIYVYVPDTEKITSIYVSSGARVGSTNTHFSLITSGIQVALMDVRTLFVGKGWGTEYYYTQEFFGNSKYGNFHSGWISMFVQGGLLSLIAYILYVIKPIFRNKAMLPIIISLVWSNSFYQFSSDPLYWILLAIINSIYIQRIDL